jgi:hypothetical protein
MYSSGKNIGGFFLGFPFIIEFVIDDAEHSMRASPIFYEGFSWIHLGFSRHGYFSHQVIQSMMFRNAENDDGK